MLERFKLDSRVLQATLPQSPHLTVNYLTLEELERDYHQNLSKGRAFVSGHCAEHVRAPVQLVLARSDTGETFEWGGEIVWVSRSGPTIGTGVELTTLTRAEREALERFMSAPDSAYEEASRTRNIHDRIRHLSAAEREHVARSGSLPERVALERHFGGVVWEGLLQNPGLTLSEVTRLAKNGALPKPLVQRIVANPGWLANPEVRRALLSNPRVAGAHLDSVLGAMSPSERAHVAQNSAYRPQVRNLAKRLTTVRR